MCDWSPHRLVTIMFIDVNGSNSIDIYIYRMMWTTHKYTRMAAYYYDMKCDLALRVRIHVIPPFLFTDCMRGPGSFAFSTWQHNIDMCTHPFVCLRLSLVQEEIESDSICVSCVCVFVLLIERQRHMCTFNKFMLSIYSTCFRPMFTFLFFS